MEKEEVLIFKDDVFTLENIIFDGTNVWLTLNQISLLFERATRTILRYIVLVKTRYDKFDTLLCKNFTPSNEQTLKNCSHIKVYNQKFIKQLLTYIPSEKAVRFLKWLEQLLLSKNSNKLLENQNQLLQSNNYEIACFEDGDFKLDVNVSPKEETIWLTQKQMSELFDTSLMNINLHINNILEEGELDRSVLKESFITALDGKKYLTSIYNLDMVISVGYRVKSKRGILFRKWANKLIKEYLLKGYVINNESCCICKDAIIKIQQDIARIEERLNYTIKIDEGEELKGYLSIKRFIEKAKHYILIVDNYFDNTFDEVIKNVGVETIIITNTKNSKIDTNEIYQVIKTNMFHDRYIIVDDICYKSGASFKDLGKKISTLSKENITKEDILKKIL